MNSFLSPRQLIASADVRPARIIAVSASAEETGAEATGVSLPVVGVSVNAFKFAFGGYEQIAIPFACQTGDAIPYYGAFSQCQVLSGAAISNLGRALVSDNAGRAVSLTAAAPGSTVNWIVGFPLDTAAAANELIRLYVSPAQTVLS